MKTILTCLSLLFLWSLAPAQASKSFFYRPGLEVTLPSTEWQKRGQGYEEAMWQPGQLHLTHSKSGIEINFVCELLDKMEISPDSMEWLTEERIRYMGQTFKREEVNGFAMFLLDPLEDEGSYPYVAEKIHPWGYFVSMSFKVPSRNRKEADAKARSIVGNFHLRTPAEIDKLLGLPYPPSLNRDSLLAARKDEIRETFKEKYPKDYLEAEIAKIKPEELLWDASPGYCWDKLYKLRAQFAAGDMDWDEALNHLLLEMDSPDIALYLEEFPTDGEPLYVGTQKCIGRFLRPAIDTSRYDGYIADGTKFYQGEETYYWSVADAKDSLSSLLLCFHRQDNQWKAYHRTLTYSRPMDGCLIHDHLPSHANDPFGSSGEGKPLPQHHLNTLYAYDEEYPNAPAQWVFNAMVPNSNCIPLTAFPPMGVQYEVSYEIRDLDDLNGRAYSHRPDPPANFRDSVSFERYYGLKLLFGGRFEVVAKNAELRQEVCKSPTLCSYFSPKDPNSEDPNRAEDWADEQHDIEMAAREIMAMQLGPEQRRYLSPLLFKDLDEDGQEEMIQFLLSNGTLLELHVFEASAKGVDAVEATPAWKQRVMATPEFRRLQRVSLQPENVLARLERDW